MKEKTMNNELSEQEQMVEEFQCPGCVSGNRVNCGNYESCDFGDGAYCQSHVPGTTIYPIGRVFLGMPKGFNRLGPIDRDMMPAAIVLFTERLNVDFYDDFNVPVWAMEKDGYLFVRVFSPRNNLPRIDVVKNGNWDLVWKSTIDVGKFIDEID